MPKTTWFLLKRGYYADNDGITLDDYPSLSGQYCGCSVVSSMGWILVAFIVVPDGFNGLFVLVETGPISISFES